MSSFNHYLFIIVDSRYSISLDSFDGTEWIPFYRFLLLDKAFGSPFENLVYVTLLHT